MVFVGMRTSENPQMMTTEAVGGSPYGPSTMPRDDKSAPTEEEQITGRSLGRRVTRVSARLAGTDVAAVPQSKAA
jgi:NAD(P)H dehydrogenase (quinone)